MTDKPLPQPTPRTQPFWDALKAHRVDIQQCDDCQHWIFFPRLHCPRCFSHSLTWKTVSGEGELLTYLNTTLVSLEEDEIQVGMRVRPVFDDIVPGETTLLRYTAKR